MQGIEGTYFHVRVLIGMVVGLAIGNLLRGIARVISDEKHRPIYWVQMAWALQSLWLLRMISFVLKRGCGRQRAGWPTRFL